jgi:hypothetical protein
MIRAINQSHKRNKIRVFENLKNFQKNNSMKKDLQVIAYVKLISSTKKLFNFYQKKENDEKFQNLIKSFKKWKNNCVLINSIHSLNLEMENKIKNKLHNFKKDHEVKSLSLEKENLDFKNKLENLNFKISEEKNKLINCEEKEKKLISNINHYEDERLKLVATKSLIEKEKLNFEEKFAELESYNKELESTVRSLCEESKEKDVSINMYVREMNEMLEVFEKKSGKILILIFLNKNF